MIVVAAARLAGKSVIARSSVRVVTNSRHEVILAAISEVDRNERPLVRQTALLRELDLRVHVGGQRSNRAGVGLRRRHVAVEGLAHQVCCFAALGTTQRVRVRS